MSGSDAMVILDEAVAFNIIDDRTDPRKATGIMIKASGIPPIQKATVERVLYTQEFSDRVAVPARTRESGQPVPSLERHSNSSGNGGSSVFLW